MRLGGSHHLLHSSQHLCTGGLQYHILLLHSCQLALQATALSHCSLKLCSLLAGALCDCGHLGCLLLSSL